MLTMETAPDDIVTLIIGADLLNFTTIRRTCRRFSRWLFTFPLWYCADDWFITREEWIELAAGPKSTFTLTVISEYCDTLYIYDKKDLYDGTLSNFISTTAD